MLTTRILCAVLAVLVLAGCQATARHAYLFYPAGPGGGATPDPDCKYGLPEGALNFAMDRKDGLRHMEWPWGHGQRREGETRYRDVVMLDPKRTRAFIDALMQDSKLATPGSERFEQGRFMIRPEQPRKPYKRVHDVIKNAVIVYYEAPDYDQEWEPAPAGESSFYFVFVRNDPPGYPTNTVTVAVVPATRSGIVSWTDPLQGVNLYDAVWTKRVNDAARALLATARLADGGGGDE